MSRSYSTIGTATRIAKTKGETHRRGKLWYALRVLRCTTVGTLLAVAEQDNRRSALTFLRQLRQAGFVRMVRSERRNVAPMFVLARDSGPKCPSILKRGAAVYDHNTQTEYAIDGR